MTFKNCHFPADLEVQVAIGNQVVERVTKTEFLGVFMDHKISWKPQKGKSELNLPKA